MKKSFFSLSFALLAIFAIGCKQQGGTVDKDALKETYENKMDSMKVSLMRSYNAKIDSMQRSYDAKIKELEVKMGSASQGISAGKAGAASTSKGKATGTTNADPKKGSVKDRGSNNAAGSSSGNRKGDVRKRGG